MTPPVSRGRHNRKKKRTVRRRLPMRYLLPSVLLVALLAMLMLRGYVHSEILADHRVQAPAPTTQVPDHVLEGGPVIDASACLPGPATCPAYRCSVTASPDTGELPVVTSGPDADGPLIPSPTEPPAWWDGAWETVVIAGDPPRRTDPLPQTRITDPEGAPPEEEDDE